MAFDLSMDLVFVSEPVSEAHSEDHFVTNRGRVGRVESFFPRVRGHTPSIANQQGNEILRHKQVESYLSNHSIIFIYIV